MEKQLKFKSYKEPTLLNKIITILGWLWLLSIIAFITFQKYDINLSVFVWLFFILLFFVGLISIMIGFLAGSIFKTTQLYKIDGIIYLNKDAVLIDDREFLIKNISIIHFYCHNVKNVAYGKGAISDGSNNYIKIKTNNQSLKRKFIIESIKQRDELKQYLLYLKSIGSNIYVDGIDLI